MIIQVDLYLGIQVHHVRMRSEEDTKLYLSANKHYYETSY
jgi:hypothetical protein